MICVRTMKSKAYKHFVAKGIEYTQGYLQGRKISNLFSPEYSEAKKALEDLTKSPQNKIKQNFIVRLKEYKTGLEKDISWGYRENENQHLTPVDRSFADNVTRTGHIKSLKDLQELFPELKKE